MPYVIRQETLRKWAEKHLVMRAVGDQIDCDFLYTGSTCSNGGVEILARLHFVVRPECQDYRIVDAEISTRSGDVGLEMSCQYQLEGDEFLTRHLDDCAVVGHLLSEFVQRDVECAPSGCFCQSPNVMHKCQMALQTIHYALQEKPHMAGRAPK